MIISGSDELGWSPFKAIAKVGAGAAKFATGPVLNVAAAAGVPGAAQAKAVKGALTKKPAAAAPALPPCGFFQKIHRAFGGKPACATPAAGKLRGLGAPTGIDAYRAAMAAEGGTSGGRPLVLGREYAFDGLGVAPVAAIAPLVKTVVGTPITPPPAKLVLGMPEKTATIAGSMILGGVLVYGLTKL